MLPNVVTRGTARLAASLALAALAALPAIAGDRALADFIGFSEDGQHFAFEEFGVQDGSGFPYSNIYVLDLAADKWVSGTPIRVRIDQDYASLEQARQQAGAKAAPVIAKLGIDTPADLIAVNADGEPGDGTSISFGEPGYLPNDVQGEFSLELSTFPAKSPDDCETYMGEPANGIALTLTGPQGETEIYRDGPVLPASRGCPTIYRIFAVVAPPYTVPPAAHVGIIAVYPFGFEGPDRRFIAIPLSK